MRSALPGVLVACALAGTPLARAANRECHAITFTISNLRQGTGTGTMHLEGTWSDRGQNDVPFQLDVSIALDSETKGYVYADVEGNDDPCHDKTRFDYKLTGLSGQSAGRKFPSGSEVATPTQTGVGLEYRGTRLSAVLDGATIECTPSNRGLINALRKNVQKSKSQHHGPPPPPPPLPPAGSEELKVTVAIEGGRTLPLSLRACRPPADQPAACAKVREVGAALRALGGKVVTAPARAGLDRLNAALAEGRYADVPTIGDEVLRALPR